MFFSTFISFNFALGMQRVDGYAKLRWCVTFFVFVVQLNQRDFCLGMAINAKNMYSCFLFSFQFFFAIAMAFVSPCAEFFFSVFVLVCELFNFPFSFVPTTKSVARASQETSSSSSSSPSARWWRKLHGVFHTTLCSCNPSMRKVHPSPICIALPDTYPMYASKSAIISIIAFVFILLISLARRHTNGGSTTAVTVTGRHQISLHCKLICVLLSTAAILLITIFWHSSEPTNDADSSASAYNFQLEGENELNIFQSSRIQDQITTKQTQKIEISNVKITKKIEMLRTNDSKR